MMIRNLRASMRKGLLIFRSGREYAFRKEDVVFPYRFGNQEAVKQNLSQPSPHFVNVVGGLKQVYKTVLTDVQSGATKDMKEYMEGRLYRRFLTDYTRLKNEGYSFSLQNPQADINVNCTGFKLIWGGKCDRDQEATLGMNKPYNLLNMGIFYLDSILRDPHMPLIVQFTAQIQSKFKLTLLDKAGQGMDCANDLPEYHEVNIEGVIATNLAALNTINIAKVLGDFHKNMKELRVSNYILVDFDNALKGNPHIHEY